MDELEPLPYDLTDAEVVHLMKEDAKKMFSALKQLREWKKRTLLAPTDLPSNQAKGFMVGSNAAFAHGSDLANFIFSKLYFDYEKVEELDKESLI